MRKRRVYWRIEISNPPPFENTEQDKSAADEERHRRFRNRRDAVGRVGFADAAKLRPAQAGIDAAIHAVQIFIQTVGLGGGGGTQLHGALGGKTGNPHGREGGDDVAKWKIKSQK